MLTEANFRQLPVFITSMSRWDGDLSSASLALAKVLSRQVPVYYIDFPYSYTDYWRERKQPSVKQRRNALFFGKNFLQPVSGQHSNLYSATPKLVMPFFSMPPGALYKLFSHHNNKIVAGMVEKICQERGVADYLFLNSFNPSYLSNIGDYLKPVLSIYQSRDAIEELHEHGAYREDTCVRNYNLTLATSKRLCQNIESRAGCAVQYLPNGGDIRLFRTAVEQSFPKPPELQHIDTPIIGYTGAVCQRIDYELVIKIAKAHPDKTLVFVGPRKDKQYTAIDLDAIQNIVFTGPKGLDELPAYLQHFDCAIIPFRYNDLTAGIYPLKINEYLAAGKAVVTTDFSEDIAAFRKLVYLAFTHDDFLESINKAVADNSRSKQEERLKEAEQNSWEKRVETFWETAWAAYQKKESRQVQKRNNKMRVV